MGLDLVELVMECEDEFNIAIPDEDYEHLQSVGAMYEYVIRKKEREIDDSNRPRVCLTMITFSLLRPGLQSIADVPRRSIRTKTTTEKLIPQLRRRSDWKEIQVQSGLQLPQLDRPTWMDETLLTSVIVAVAIVVYWLATIMHVAVAVGLGLILIGPLLFRLLSQLTQPLATLIPADCATVGGLSRSVESLNRGILEERYNGWSSEYVWRRLRGIVSEQLGVPLDQVNYDSRFVEDLGAD